MALPRGAMGLSAICDCSISWSYSLTIFAQTTVVLLIVSNQLTSNDSQLTFVMSLYAFIAHILYLALSPASH